MKKHFIFLFNGKGAEAQRFYFKLPPALAGGYDIKFEMALAKGAFLAKALITAQLITSS